MTSCLVDFFEHNRWANLQMIDTCTPLTDTQLGATVDGTYGTIRDTLIHLVVSETSYVARLRNTERPRSGWRDEFPGFPTLRAAAAQSGADLIELAANADATRMIRGQHGNGQRFALPMGILLVQAVNHATEHRSQIATILTQLGIEPPALDGWSFGVSQARAGG